MFYHAYPLSYGFHNTARSPMMFLEQLLQILPITTAVYDVLSSKQCDGILMDGSSNNKNPMKTHTDEGEDWHFGVKNPMKPGK